MPPAVNVTTGSRPFSATQRTSSYGRAQLLRLGVELLGRAGSASRRIPPKTARMCVTALTMSPVPASPFVADHRRALGDAPERLAEVRAAADERDGELPLVDVVLEVGGRQHLGLVDVVDLERLEDLRLDEVPDPALRHHRDRHRLLDLRDLLRVGHARDAAVAPDVGRDALERHHRARACVLGDLRLLGVDDVHDHPALEHLGEAALDAHRADVGHRRNSSREEGLDGVPKGHWLFQEREVAGPVEEHDLGVRNRPGGSLGGGGRAADEVVSTGDHERRRGDAPRRLAQVRDGGVELLERLGRGPVDLDLRAVALVPLREVRGRHVVPHPRELLRRLVVGRVLARKCHHRRLVPGLTALRGEHALGLGGHLVGDGEKRRREDQLPHAFGMGGRIGGGDHPAVGVSEQVDLLLAERRAQLLEVGDVVVECVRVGGAALPRAARVQKQQRARRPSPARSPNSVPENPGPPGWQSSSGPFPRRSYEIFMCGAYC